MIYIAKLIAFTLAAQILSRFFPTFWGGFYTAIAFFAIASGISITMKVKEMKEENKND